MGVVTGYVPKHVRPEISNAVGRALAVGAQAPLAYQGTGASGIVFCDRRGHAYKVARVGREESVADEAEYLATAARVPGVREHVPPYYQYHPKERVIERGCVVGRAPRWSDPSPYDLHERITARMKREGWGAVEYKDDSFVTTPDGSVVLVDAGHSIRLGDRMLAYAEDVLAGRRPWGTNRPEDLAHALRMEVAYNRLTEDDPRVRETFAALAVASPTTTRKTHAPRAPHGAMARRGGARGATTIGAVAIMAGVSALAAALWSPRVRAWARRWTRAIFFATSSITGDAPTPEA